MNVNLLLSAPLIPSVAPESRVPILRVVRQRNGKHHHVGFYCPTFLERHGNNFSYIGGFNCHTVTVNIGGSSTWVTLIITSTVP